MQDGGSFDSWLQASRDSARAGHHAQGAEQARRALALSESGEARTLLALHQLRLGELGDCMASGHAALPLLQAPEQAALLAQAECTLTVACLQAEFLQQALLHAQRGADAAKRSGDELALAWCHNRLAQTHRVLGDPQRAQALFDQALTVAQRLGDQPLQFSILYNRAWPFVEQALRGALSDPAPLIEAIALLERAQLLADGNVHSQGICMLNRSRCLQSMGRQDESRQLAELALALGEAHQLTQLIVGAQTVLGEVMLRSGDAVRALQILLEARRVLSQADLIGQIDLLRIIVKSHRQLGRFESALDAFAELHELSLRQARARADLQAWMLLHQQEVERERQQRQRAELDAELERLSAARWEAEAHHDPLTGLANRRFVSARLAALVAHGQQTELPLLAAMLDLDHFKAINDRHGHELGDAVLRQVGELLLRHVRPRDMPARLGGEEFLVLLPDSDPMQALQACERLRARIAEHPWHELQAGLRVTVSIGLAPVGPPDAPWKAADEALYSAKAGGRNRLVTAC